MSVLQKKSEITLVSTDSNWEADSGYLYDSFLSSGLVGSLMTYSSASASFSSEMLQVKVDYAL